MEFRWNNLIEVIWYYFVVRAIGSYEINYRTRYYSRANPVKHRLRGINSSLALDLKNSLENTKRNRAGYY